jgi:CTD nuclear envelope phosphatase 1
MNEGYVHNVRAVRCGCVEELGDINIHCRVQQATTTEVVFMNTLGYVARQFDVLAAAKTPPSTPTSSHRAELPRVSSWSTKSLFNSTRLPKRSHSSPSFPSPPTSVVDSQPQSKEKHIEAVFNRIFFIRAFLLVWDQLRSACSSLYLTIRRTTKEIDSSPPPPTPPSVDTPSTLPTPPSSASHSPAGTPTLATKKTPFHLVPKTLVLDLDETLIHSTSRPIPSQSTGSGSLLTLGSWGKANRGTGHMVEVVLGSRSTLYHVYKRPFVDFFLRTVCIYCPPRCLCIVTFLI